MRKKNSPQYHFQKHPNTRGSHPHTVTLLQIMKYTLTLKRKEKEARRRFIEKGWQFGNWRVKRRLESSEICCELWFTDLGKGKTKTKNNFTLENEKEKRTREYREKAANLGSEELNSEERFVIKKKKKLCIGKWKRRKDKRV